VKFLAITSSNLDEFVEIRVAGILQRLEENTGLPQLTDDGGLTQEQRLDRLRILLHQFSQDQSVTWNSQLAPALAKADIRILQWKDLRASDRAFATKYFQEQVDPLLTPVTIDPSHPFPRVLNKALFIAMLLSYKRKAKSGGNQKVLGVITIPRSLHGLITLPQRDGCHNFILLHDLIEAHLEPMFRGYTILSRAICRVTRNSNLYM
jgi:polyphosphate kinase